MNSRSRDPLFQIRQNTLDLLALPFEEARQLEVTSQRRDRLVDGEAGDVGRDLEQHAAGLAEVERAEVVAVLLVGRADAMVLGELAPHRELRLVVGSAERDVVHRTGALRAAEELAGHADIDDAADLAPVRLEADGRTLAAEFREAEHVGQDRRRGRRVAKEQADAVEAADRMLDRYLAAAPPRLLFDAGH